MRRLCAIALLLAVAGCSYPAPDPNARRFVVFFQQWSAALDDPALAAIQAAVDDYRLQSGERLLVIGFADPTGSRAANDYLSQLRAQVVADQLFADGVPPANVTIQGRGETRYKLSSQESRRVEIVATR